MHFSWYLNSYNGQKSWDKCIYFDKSDLRVMSRTAITLKFKMCWFPNEGCFWAGKLKTGINLVPLMPDEDKTFSGSLVLDLRVWWRHVHTLFCVGRLDEPIALEHRRPRLSLWGVGSFLVCRGRKQNVPCIYNAKKIARGAIRVIW